MEVLDTISKKLEDILEGYINNLKDKPIATIIKTAIVLWLISKIKKYLK